MNDNKTGKCPTDVHIFVLKSISRFKTKTISPQPHIKHGEVFLPSFLFFSFFVVSLNFFFNGWHDVGGSPVRTKSGDFPDAFPREI